MDWSNDSQTASNIYKTSLGVRDVEGCFTGKTNLLLIQNYQGDGHRVSWGLGKRKRPCRKNCMRNSINRSTKTWIISLSLMKCTAEFFSTSVHSSQIFFIRSVKTAPIGFHWWFDTCQLSMNPLSPYTLTSTVFFIGRKHCCFWFPCRDDPWLIILAPSTYVLSPCHLDSVL